MGMIKHNLIEGIGVKSENFNCLFTYVDYDVTKRRMFPKD